MLACSRLLVRHPTHEAEAFGGVDVAGSADEALPNHPAGSAALAGQSGPKKRLSELMGLVCQATATVRLSPGPWCVCGEEEGPFTKNVNL